MSVRWPTSPPVARSFSSCGVRPARLSGADDQPVACRRPCRRSSAGSASTWLSLVSTHTRNPTTATSSTTSSTSRLRPRRRAAAAGARRSGGSTGGARSGRRGGPGSAAAGRRPRASARWAAAACGPARRRDRLRRGGGLRSGRVGPGGPGRRLAAPVRRRRRRADRPGAVAPRGRRPHSSPLTALPRCTGDAARRRCDTVSPARSPSRAPPRFVDRVCPHDTHRRDPGRGRASTPRRTVEPSHSKLGAVDTLRDVRRHEPGATPAFGGPCAGSTTRRDRLFRRVHRRARHAGRAAVVVGHWPSSPFGAFTDVMVERPDGHRMLLAPTAEVAGFVARDVHLRRGVPRPRRRDRRPTTGGPCTRGPLDLAFTVGRRSAARRAPARGAAGGSPPTRGGSPRSTSSPAACCPACGPGAAPGRGGASTTPRWTCTGSPARGSRGTGADQGGLTPVDPPVRFGFGSTPRAPSLVRWSRWCRGDGCRPSCPTRTSPRARPPSTRSAWASSGSRRCRCCGR